MLKIKLSLRSGDSFFKVKMPHQNVATFPGIRHYSLSDFHSLNKVIAIQVP